MVNKSSVKKKVVKRGVERKKDIEEDQIKLIIFVMIGLVVLFFVFTWAVKSFNEFEYEGLKFTKEQYSEDIDVFHYERYYTDSNGGLVKYNLYLREDPRENNVPVEGEIDFPKGKFIYTSINSTGLVECPNVLRDYAGLTEFLINNDATVRSATPDEAEAEQLGVKFANCENRPNNPVILVERGEKTEIVKENLCYRISVNNCEFLDAVEKFKTQALIDARNRAGL